MQYKTNLTFDKNFLLTLKGNTCNLQSLHLHWLIICDTIAIVVYQEKELYHKQKFSPNGVLVLQYIVFQHLILDLVLKCAMYYKFIEARACQEISQLCLT